jgi:hypothetical protein
MTPEDYVKYKLAQELIVKEARIKINVAYKMARNSGPRKILRPATPEDIVLNNIIWVHDEDRIVWQVVEEVLNPKDNWKAYDFDGCRYGLYDAFVEE